MMKGELAKSYFMQGYNCSQSVAMAFSEEMKMDIEQVKRLTIGFGGGMGRMREVCGAVSGMTFVISLRDTVHYRNVNACCILAL